MNIWGRWRAKKRAKLYSAADFDAVALEQMRAQLRAIQAKIASIDRRT
jgi:hypothetical protein